MKRTEDSIKVHLTAKERKKDQVPMGKLDAEGCEVPDPNPLFLRVGEKRPPRVNERINEVIQLQKMMMREDESDIDPDEEQDFDIPDEDPQVITPYEVEGRVQEMMPDHPEPEKENDDLQNFAKMVASEIQKSGAVDPVKDTPETDPV